MAENVNPEQSAAYTVLRQLARLRAQYLVQYQDKRPCHIELLPTTTADVSIVDNALRKAADDERHHAIVALIREIDAADRAKNKKLSAALNRVCDELKTRGALTELAVAK